MKALKILVIEDNQDLAANLLEFLAAKGHIVDSATDGTTGLNLATAGNHDVIVLDLVLPGMDGITLCRRLREDAHKHTPVLMLTARDSLEDKILGLESGADDYVVKPFALREVEARLLAMARRTAALQQQAKLKLADLLFDTTTLTVSRNSRRIELPPIPLTLLEHLMRASPRVLSREELERDIWGDSPPDSDALRAHMHILRSAIDGPTDIPLLRTVRGRGWQLADPDAPAT
jgi:DNA-binding response OmpR family regulator